MKNILLLALIFISTVAFAQVKTEAAKPKPSTTIKANTPGNCLIKSSSSTIGGLLMMSAGTIIMVHSANPKVENEADALRTVGMLCITTGAILQIRGIVLIGKAGKMMEDERQKSLTYSISPTKVGLALNF